MLLQCTDAVGGQALPLRSAFFLVLHLYATDGRQRQPVFLQLPLAQVSACAELVVQTQAVVLARLGQMAGVALERRGDGSVSFDLVAARADLLLLRDCAAAVDAGGVC